MVRNTYGGTVYDVAVIATNPAQLALAADGAYPLFNASGVAQTDFLLWNPATSAFDITATSVSVTSGFLPLFQGPNATELYDGAGHRLPHFDNIGSGTGFYTLPAGGIPESDLDSTTQSKIDAAAATTAALAAKAPLASPTFTGDPKAPTPATTDSDTSIATTAFVQAAAAAKVAKAPWMWTGDLLGVGGSAPIEVPVASTVTALKLRVDTGPVGSALTVELHKNAGGAGWVTQDSLTIADGAVGPVSKTGLAITFAAGDLVRLYNVAVGSSSAARGVSLVATLA